MKAAVIGVGTELTDGQILNKNAAWISTQLKRVGIQTTHHLVVPDDRKLITQALDFCSAQCDILFVTGGLGPTSDDFTRELVTEWIHQPLEFDQDSWNHLSERLTSHGYEVKELQRQQCYFPRGAKILFNPEGTANAFQVHYKKKELFILPGPPREIKAIWNLSIDWWLKEKTEGLDRFVTRMWDTMGKGESDIATLVEDTLTGVDVEKGYRVHLPYVEVKVSYHQSMESQFASALASLTEALRFCTITRDGEDLAESFAKLLEEISSVRLCDQVSGPFLMSRLLPSLRPFMSKKIWTLSNAGSNMDPGSTAADLQLSLIPIDENSAEVGFEYRGHKILERIQTPFLTTNMQERRQQYLAESALIFWLQQLQSLFQKKL